MDVWPETRCLGDDSGVVWGSVLAVIGLLHLGLTGAAGAMVWSLNAEDRTETDGAG
jgi:hypothetical protein